MQKNKTNTKILFIGCNTQQLPYLEELRSRNYYIIGIDKNPNALGRNLCNKFYDIGYDSIDEIINIGVENNFSNKDKIFTAAAQFAHQGASVFASHFGIKYPSQANIVKCLDKAAYYKIFLDIGVPIPNTRFIKDKFELDEAINRSNEDSAFYLKSDFSKNPNYVYRFKTSDYKNQNIYWGRDRYLRNHYILQEEFTGPSLRINCYGLRYNVYDFNSGQKTNEFNNKLAQFNVIEYLYTIMNYFDMGDWLIKFDVILNDRGFVVLDIGMDPPFRMNRSSHEIGINFQEHYLNQYLDYNITYPKILD